MNNQFFPSMVIQYIPLIFIILSYPLRASNEQANNTLPDTFLMQDGKIAESPIVIDFQEEATRIVPASVALAPCRLAEQRGSHSIVVEHDDHFGFIVSVKKEESPKNGNKSAQNNIPKERIEPLIHHIEPMIQANALLFKEMMDYIAAKRSKLPQFSYGGNKEKFFSQCARDFVSLPDKDYEHIIAYILRRRHEETAEGRYEKMMNEVNRKKQELALKIIDALNTYQRTNDHELFYQFCIELWSLKQSLYYNNMSINQKIEYSQERREYAALVKNRNDIIYKLFMDIFYSEQLYPLRFIIQKNDVRFKSEWIKALKAVIESPEEMLILESIMRSSSVDTYTAWLFNNGFLPKPALTVPETLQALAPALPLKQA